MSTSPTNGTAGHASLDRRHATGGLVGHKDLPLDAGASAQAGTTHENPEWHDAAVDGLPIGSALATRGGSSQAGAGGDLASGPATLGATAGGERASAGRADANRNSRDDGNSRDI